MAKRSATNLIAELVTEMAGKLGAMVTSRVVSSRHSTTGFSTATDDNSVYVLYAANGAAMGVGVVYSSMSTGERTAFATAVNSLTESRVIASYRKLYLGVDDLTTQVHKWILDFFGHTLPLGNVSGMKSSGPARKTTKKRRRGRLGKKAAARRGPGRPRKNPEVAAAPVKRGPGRPRKNPEVAAAPVKRGPGRPRKNPEVAAAPVKRGPGRPRKNPEVAAAPVKRGPGRPRKNPEVAGAPVKRGPGRPRKNPEVAGAPVKRGPGRPRKNA